MPQPAYQIYPAYCFSASPTYKTWAKLTGADLQTLHSVAGFEGQDLYFYRNHPVRFVQVIGVITSIFDIGPNFIILCIDDGSGIAVDVKLERGADEVVPNLTVYPNGSSIPSLVSMSTPIVIGTVVKVKGIPCTYRKTYQILLRRLSVIRSTEDEVKAWADLVKFRSNVLLHDWTLTFRDLELLKKRKQRRLDRRERGNRRQQREKILSTKEEQERNALERDYNQGALI